MDPVIQRLSQQLNLMELFTERLGASNQTPSQTKLIMSGEALENSITEFHSDTGMNSTFSTWFVHFEDIFNVDFREQTNDLKFRLLLRKMGPSEHDKYSNYILLRHPRDCSFAETVETLKDIFASTPHSSLLRSIA